MAFPHQCRKVIIHVCDQMAQHKASTFLLAAHDTRNGVTPLEIDHINARTAMSTGTNEDDRHRSHHTSGVLGMFTNRSSNHCAPSSESAGHWLYMGSLFINVHAGRDITPWSFV